MRAQKSKMVRWYVVAFLPIIFIALAGIAWGASGSVTITSPGTADPIEVTGNFSVQGTYIMSEDESPTGRTTTERCYFSYHTGVACLSPSYYDQSQWVGTHSALYYQVDDQPPWRIGEVNWWSGPSGGTQLGELKTFSFTVDLSQYQLDPSAYHTVRVYLKDMYGLLCEEIRYGCRSYWSGSGDQFAWAKLDFIIVGENAPTSTDDNLGKPEICPPPFTENPINLTTGNKYFEEADFAIKAVGGGLSFTRSYNSQSATDGPLGYGWTHNYNLILKVLDATRLRMMKRDGGYSYFEQTDEGLYRGTGDEHAYITSSVSNYVLHETDGSLYLFDENGKLLRIDDTNGNSINLSYETGLLAAVEDALSGRTLSFTYTNDKLTAVTGPTKAQNPSGLLISLDYTDGNLTQVTHADGESFLYFYEDPNDLHNLTKKTKSDGVTVLNEVAYDDQDRAIRSSLNDGNEAVDIAYGHWQATVTDTLGRTKVYKYDVLEDIGVPTEIEGAGCSGCSSRYGYESSSALTEGEFKDQFSGADGSPPDPARWIIQIGSPDIQGNKLWLDASNSDERIESVEEFSGDFDIQVDFNVDTAPATSGWSFLLHAMSGSHEIGVRYGYRGSHYQYWFTFYDGSWHNIGVASYLQESSGKLRLTRSGNVFRAYRWYSGGWHQVGDDKTFFAPSEPVTVRLGLSRFENNPEPKGYLDNLKQFRASSGAFENEFEDQFNGMDGSAPDPARWIIQAGSPDIQGSRLWLDTTSSDELMDSVAEFSGDFDVQVDFETVAGPIGNGWAYVLDAISGDFRIGTRVGSDGSSDYRYWFTYYDGSWHDVGSGFKVSGTNAFRSVESAKLRLTRTGNVFRAYRWWNGQWSQLDSDKIFLEPFESVTITLGLTKWGTNSVAQGYLDNFKIVHGELALPQNFNLLSRIDGNGVTTQYDYHDLSGNARKIIEALGTVDERHTDYTYHPRLKGKPLTIGRDSVLSPWGQKVTTYDYDSDGNSVPNENPTNRIYRMVETGYTRNGSGMTTQYTHETKFTYNAAGQFTSVDGPRPGSSDTISYTYHVNGDFDTITRPLTGTVTFDQYDALGNVGRVIDENGNETTFTYDLRGQVASITNAAGTTNITRNDLGANGRYEVITQPNGTSLTYVYNAAGYLIEIADSLNSRIVYGYDTKGDHISEEVLDSGGTLKKSIQYQYDQFDRLWKVLYPEGTDYDEFGYDNVGNRTSSTDALGRLTQYVYDSLSRLGQVIQPGDATTGYDYDSADNLTSVIDAEGHTTTYTYDDAGRLLESISPDAGTTTYTYDEAGNLISKTDANGAAVTYAYDSLNRLILIDFPNDPDVTYTYDEGADGKGRLTGMVDWSGAYSYFYDALGNLIRKDKTVEGIIYTTQYSYDAAGLLTGMTYPDGRVVTYELDGAGRVARVTTTKDSVTQTLAENISHAPFGPMTALTYGNGMVLSRSLDQRYRFTGIQAGNVLDLTYGHDGVGNITAITDGLDAPRSQSFGYDSLDRLTSATGIYGTIGYTYDNVGNRTTRTVDAQTDTYAYIAGTNRLSAVTGVNPASFGYDASGNITSVGEKEFLYSDNNRLTQSLADGLVVGDYVYNGQGQRIKKQTDSMSRIYIYDLQGNILAEADGSGNILFDYVYVNGERLALIDSGGISGGGLEPITDLYARAKSSKVQLTWTSVAGATCYNVYRGEAMGGPYNRIAECHVTDYSTYLDADVVNGTTYYYVVTSLDGEGRESDNSNETSATPSERIRRYGRGLGERSLHQLALGLQDGLQLGTTLRRPERLMLSSPGDITGLLVQFGAQQTPAEVIYYYHNDHLSTPQKITDENGVVVWSADYAPFGEASVTTATAENNFRFPGQYFDSETGLHYNLHRYYDPKTGRYLRPDPIGLEGGVNPYTYSSNNPVNIIDAYGLQAGDVFGDPWIEQQFGIFFRGLPKVIKEEAIETVCLASDYVTCTAKCSLPRLVGEAASQALTYGAKKALAKKAAKYTAAKWAAKVIPVAGQVSTFITAEQVTECIVDCALK